MCNKKFAVRLSSLLVGVLIGAALAYIGVASSAQTVVKAPQPYQLDVARGMGMLMQSQCFNSTDQCCEYAERVVNATTEYTSAAGAAHHLVEGMNHLVEMGCIEATDGCPEFAFGLITGPVTRSVFTYPLPHEGE
jgi:hypothetical protein